MAGCVAAQYKATAVPSGVYSTACTEGTVQGAADAARVAALSARFRAGHRSTAAKYGDFYEARRQAIAGTHGCSHEERLVGAYPRVAAAMVAGQSEAARACVRYAAPASPAEAYMAASVDRQMKGRGAVGGTYAPSCTDGAAGGRPRPSASRRWGPASARRRRRRRTARQPRMRRPSMRACTLGTAARTRRGCLTSMRRLRRGCGRRRRGTEGRGGRGGGRCAGNARVVGRAPPRPAVWRVRWWAAGAARQRGRASTGGCLVFCS
eukprot:TRINITY_DN3467_c0_g1_i1.p3 TRINITY_DN3467_c0_g1~~TRINITY_DN3467_c0_g1_i1.p3  ORF type:complete len:265 (+),score=44.36 TRINITY_DN3467_c0_g1_i1:2-796(+)